MRNLSGVFKDGWLGITTWHKRSCYLTLSAVLMSANANGQDVIWIGKPAVRDYIAFNVHKAVEQYAELGQQIAQFELQIEEARGAYFDASTGDREAAGDKFGEILFQKDMLIAWPRVAGNDGSASLMANLNALANNGRPPDGGIPPSARAAFSNWVNALRFKTGGGLGMTPDPIQAAAALQDGSSLKEYEIYRRLRDQAEWDEWESGRNGGLRKLLVSHVVIPRTYFGENPMKRGFDHQITQLENSILQCEYTGRQVAGTVFHFWEEKPPENIATLIAMNPRAFVGLADHAVKECPPDSLQASALASAPMNMTITPQMVRESSMKSRFAPPAPDPARDEQNARAQQQVNERLAKEKDRRTKLQECAEALRVSSIAARQTKDKVALKEARDRHRECNMAVRQSY
ncbi:hypothetical protein [Pseudomonas arcuscaelestis]|uniref:hypothetical protein n=1 Tax=Pseudomonas arcuscaelestis TaxID=2710591 RepID=UPI00193CE3F7|nr:hypothetical protein [Pseudomonas arcuscaelestis]MBM3112853.1 hypothetical protein [Pseudomonas arcuscaelestis]